MINLNLFPSVSNDINHLQEQRLHTRIYLIIYSITLCLLLFYSGVIERKIIKNHLLTSMMDYEQLHEQYAQEMNCPCVKISIPYNDFVTELRVQSFQQACSPGLISLFLEFGKHERQFRSSSEGGYHQGIVRSQ